MDFFNLIFTLYFVLRWPSVVDGMLKFKNCAGAEDIQSMDFERDMNTTPLLVNSQCSEHCRHWTIHTLNATDTELTWMLLTRYPTDNWILDWTLPTLNNSRQTMNAVNCNLANTEDHWLCMLQLYPIAWMLKKLNWCYRLWTLLALNAIELSRHYRLTVNTVYTESY